VLFTGQREPYRAPVSDKLSLIGALEEGFAL